jgi:hypothetical protein
LFYERFIPVSDPKFTRVKLGGFGWVQLAGLNDGLLYMARSKLRLPLPLPGILSQGARYLDDNRINIIIIVDPEL